MTEDTGLPIKASELFRERLVAKYYNATQKLPELGSPVSRTFVPQSSNDTALIAFAQLTTLRLGAARALISLIDSRNQYVLAEATRTSSMRSDQDHDSEDSLWLGSVVIPRDQGICELVLATPAAINAPNEEQDEPDVTIIQNLGEHPRIQAFSRRHRTPCLRFYAGVPIMLPDRTKIGSFCVFDDKPRDLSADQRTFLLDMARTTMDHLEAVRLRAQHIRSHKLVNGLESFIEGLSNIQSMPYESAAREQHVSSLLDVEGRGSDRAQEAAPNTEGKPANASQSFVPRAQKLRSQLLWESALPVGTKPMFSRAANIVRQSGDYDGVAFLYISSASTRNKSTRYKGNMFASDRRRKRSSSSRSSTATPSQSSSEDAETPRKSTAANQQDTSDSNLTYPEDPCPILSLSLGSNADVAIDHEGNPFSNFRRRDLDRLVGKSPRGRTFALNYFGQLFPGDTSSSGSGTDQSNSAASSHQVAIGELGPSDSKRSGGRQHRTRDALVRSLRKFSPEGKSFVCLPLWDFERQRWFAYAICWSNTPNRDPGMDGDLHFLRIFGNTIMNALSYIDAVAANQTKTAFVSSISHELRSPLHGMLSATNFLQDSSLDRFQREMVDSISNSGRTLLDTVDHVMDFAKMISQAPQSQQESSNRRSRSQNRGQDEVVSSLSSTVDLAVLIEEVVDTIYMGFMVQHDFVYSEDGAKSSGPQAPNFTTTPENLASSSRSVSQRGRVRIALQLPFRKNWCVKTQAGAWRRIVMNLFGNSLKYTTDGLITMRLEPMDDPDSQDLSVSFTVVDTGKGISDDYLENHLFQPFSQENSFASGTGLGLSIVDQVVRTMGGETIVSSSPGGGTTVGVSLKMEIAEKKPSVLNTTEIVDHIPDRVRGLRICFLDQCYEDSPEDSTNKSAEWEYSQCLSTMLQSWFGTEVSFSTSWSPRTADIVLCLRPSFKQLQSIRSVQPVPPVILITYDALEMAVLQGDARISGGPSVVEIICQP
ncbi:MAG: hypothetical protein Q9160_003208 [Pyrenula sp. 1 TL-2023]